ncbi:MAG: hypothetical protein K0Q59_4611 [Paenibacillus sp.]|nr:hypothetical protein [Paenibacillus sp.]
MQHAIARENALPGTLDWQMTRFRFDGLRSPSIEGYASRASVYPGESIDLMISADPAGTFTIDIYRLGYYGGKGGRFMLSLGSFEGEPQETPMQTTERLRECNWKPSATLRIPDDWISGVYIAKLSRANAQSYMIFIVKQRRRTEIVVQTSDLTWQAYNKWPRGNSLYDDGLGDGNGHSYTGPNVRVSLDRPYAKYGQIVDQPMSAGTGSYLLWEFPLAYWLEAEGYDVTYCSNLDLDHDPQLLERCSVFISVGHDEYWTRQMYVNATAARDAGVNLLFLCGNSINHDIITYPNEKTGEPFRAFARGDRFLDDKELMGASSFGAGYGDWTVAKPEHWAFAGTGMKAGDSIPGLIGWEYHGAPFKITDSLEVLAYSDMIGVKPLNAPAKKHENPRVSDGKHAAVLYTADKGNIVFNAGTIWWAQGLSNPPGHIPAKGTWGRVQGPDARVQQITRNLLNRCLGR